MKTINEIKAFCASNNLNPKRIFIASNGAVMTEWHSKKQCDRFGKLLDKHLSSQGSTGSFQDATNMDLADWESVAYAEMLATRH